MIDDKLYELDCTVEHIIYRNEENGYTVIEAETESGEITAVGTMPMVCEGEQLHLIGRFTSHSSYGEQFSVSAFESIMPTTSLGILKYLSAGAVKGIGAATAARLIKAFGENTLEVMKNEPERIASIRGISLEKAKTFADQLNRAVNIRDLMAYLGSFGVNPIEAVAVYREFGNEAMNIIEENPFTLCMSDTGISFETADLIAQKKDILQDSSIRIRAGLTHILRHNTLNGHTCLPEDKLVKTAADFLSVDEEKAQAVLNELLDEQNLIKDVLRDRSFIFLPQYYESEQYISARLKMMLRFPAPAFRDAKEQIEIIESRHNIKYADKQKEAIESALQKGLLVLTGGPGTGKTTTLNAIIDVLKSNGQKVLLAAPTGRAAQRMSELTGSEAKTIHRLLEVQWDKNDKPEFKKNEQHTLDCDALVLDELSMVDDELFESVLRALPMACRLILVGDSDQLPSVGAGNVLAELIASGAIPVVGLDRIFRQSEQSLIVTNAHHIVKGEMPELTRRDSDFFFLENNNMSAARDTILGLCETRLPKTYGISPINDIQILTPGKKGILGTNELNRALQEVLNPKNEEKDEITFNNTVYRVGDKVMQVKNNYDILWTKYSGECGEGIFNGDIGIIESVNKAQRMMRIKFDDRYANYDADCAIDLELSYACTVHKSQGNEFDFVIIPLIKNSQYLFYRNLLYTAVTRAKKMLIIVGNKETVHHMVNNNIRTLRYSGLSEFLKRD
ncbi:MAG: ATP-dependent RecD-like DNA helicase [Ruminococcaceae bacterium]|nr:ATP-dependent RecD-like DNA helicase [Oscillospiraceae bacterium]